MKKLLPKLLVLLVIFTLGAFPANAACPNDNTLTAGNLTPPGVSLSVTQTYNSGQYVLAFVEAGANYTVSTCGGGSFDSQLTIYNDATGTLIAYNDDYCSLQSTVSFTPTYCGLVRVLLDQYSCQNSNLAMAVTMTQNTAGTMNPTLTSAPDVQACSGQNAPIGIANNGSGGMPPYAYLWAPATNLASTTQAQTTVTVIGTTNYVLTLTDANGCSAHDTVLVSELPPPAINLGNDTTICGGPLLLNAGNPGSSYLWSTGAGTQTLSVTSSGNYSVAVQTPNGCINSDAIVITVNPNPTVNIGPDTTSCSNAVVLDAGPGFSSYTWSTGPSTQTNSVTTSDVVSVIVTDGNGCSGTDTAVVTLSPPPAVNLGPDTVQCGGSVVLNAGNPGANYYWSNNTSSQTTAISSSGPVSVLVVTPFGCTNSDTILVTINHQPNVNLGPDTSICGSTITLDAGNPGSTYSWSNFTSGQTATLGAGTQHVTVTDPSGCSASDTIVITSNPAPPVSAGADQTICPSSNATLIASGALFYQWSNGSTNTTNSVSPAITTTYYVTGYDVNGCSASDVVLVTVLPGSNAQFTASVAGSTATFTNQSSNAVSYSWDFGDASGASNAANPSHTYTANGTYTVTLTVTGPCGTDTYTQTVVITQVGIQDNDLASTLSLYPNPNDGHFNLSFNFEKAKDVSIQVLDVSGRIVYNEQAGNIVSYNKSIGLEATESGMYFVRIITTEGVVTEKVMVQR